MRLHTLMRPWHLHRLRDPAWRTLFEERGDEYVSLDCETTSLNVGEAELLSIGAVKLRGNRILTSEALYLLVRPQTPPEKPNIEVHGLRRCDVDQGLSAEEAVLRLLDFIGGRPLLGYYLEYDVAVLDKYVKPLIGCPLPQRQIEVSGCYYDYKLRQNPNSYVDLRLASLHAELGVPQLPRHDALNDAISVAMLYLALCQRSGRR
ncbi:3'-5' exonuclease [Paludibacterium purpuratum]|uniref:DNA polymerase-3 subunit epsilon n=1 Tax=Paludibacterium purpuratum TaxID=1144873 RepID=A0A4R7AZB2_9NEIS|nr:3'-5' exonuclease [Paludibacterium purpuratum]TDR73606.1 DNA polymerase-3 subunit epsilon [Paludibacterium purpuratum]